MKRGFLRSLAGLDLPRVLKLGFGGFLGLGDRGAGAAPAGVGGRSHATQRRRTSAR
jgi:hypothetical protein